MVGGASTAVSHYKLRERTELKGVVGNCIGLIHWPEWPKIIVLPTHLSVNVNLFT